MTATIAPYPPLPAELRASQPAERRGLRRDGVRLLVLDRAAGTIEHARFDQLPSLLEAGDLLVVNSTRVVPAGVAAVRENGERVQVRPCVRRPGEWDALVVEAGPPFANVPLREGERLRAGDARLVVLGRRPDIPLLWRVAVPAADLDVVLRHGEPIRYSYVPDAVPLDLYQTVFATHPGSAESPSAGRPLTWELIGRLRERGVGLADLVLHTGLSSYQDDAFDLEHRLFEEWYRIGEATAKAISRASRIVAVGTTVVRALETAAGPTGIVMPAQEWTRLQLGAASRPSAVDALLTGMHEPQASHFDLLRAFVPERLLRRAYEEAIAHRYLWHEFGDAMLIL